MIVPDLAQMAAVNQGNGSTPQLRGYVDLYQGSVAYEALLQAITAGQTAQAGVNAANVAIANVYPLLGYPADAHAPQVVYKVVGNPNVCPNCKVKKGN